MPLVQRLRKCEIICIVNLHFVLICAINREKLDEGFYMHRERVSENVFWFQSEVYAQVTAGVVAGPQWAVVIDTLALPDETLAIREFIERELSVPVRYVINTHYHADHAWGNCFFPGATVVAHARCRDLLIERGEPSLETAKKQNPALRQVKIVPPQMTFLDGEMTLRVGKKNLIIAPAYGHSEDGISVLVEEDRILFAGDSFMPIPYIVDGDIEENIVSIKRVAKMGLDGRLDARRPRPPARPAGHPAHQRRPAAAGGCAGAIHRP